MPSTRDPRKVIEALKRKADDPSVTKEERKLLLDKIEELQAKYPKNGKPLFTPHAYSGPLHTMTPEEFTNLFGATPSGIHVTIFPVRNNKTYHFSWLIDHTQENPRGNEETWDLIDPNTDEY